MVEIESSKLKSDRLTLTTGESDSSSGFNHNSTYNIAVVIGKGKATDCCRTFLVVQLKECTAQGRWVSRRGTLTINPDWTTEILQIR